MQIAEILTEGMKWVGCGADWMYLLFVGGE
jgi:hypothetical protein